ncbi:TipJ family phage tail tip protein [Pseudoroseicyclus sp. H15]
MPAKALSAPLFDPGAGRQAIEVPPGATVASIVAELCPGADPAALRVTLVNARGAAVVSQAHWAGLRPKDGTTIVIRAVPAGDNLRPVLLAVVSIAAVSLGQYWAASLIPTAGLGQTLLAAGIAAGINVAGGLLVNALVPPPEPEQAPGRGRQVYGLAGWRNETRPGAPVPLVLGRMRYAPPFAARSWTEIVGDERYIRALFTFGYGELDISDIRIGETPISEFDEVEVETRSGADGDEPVSLYPYQVIEEAASVELVRPLPRDDFGEVEEGASIETPIVRVTSADTAKITALIGFPSGLFRVNDDGDIVSLAVNTRIRQRPFGTTTWTTVTTLNISARQREAFVRAYTWEPPSRGRWEVEVTRMTDERTDTQVSDRAVLAALQSIRPEYPIALQKGLALVAVRVRATYQLNGTLENLNAIVQRKGMVRDGGVWTTALTRNPASAFLTALMGPQNPFPVAESGIDMDAISDWFNYCETKGLKYNAVHDQSEPLARQLRAICGAGRASPRHDGLRWTVVVDRPQSLVVDHVSPRNSGNFRWRRQYLDPPEGFRVRFFDETNNWQQAERIVPWPGFSGEPTLTEALDLPGKTNPDEVWIEARRRMYELIHRPDLFEATQDGAARVATRGDLVMLSQDVLEETQVAARVRSVAGTFATLDEEIEMEAGISYGLRFRTWPTSDPVGTSIVAGVVTRAGVSQVIELEDEADVPPVGHLVHFGVMGQESLPVRVSGIEPAEGMAARLTMLADAPEIDTLTDAEEPPAWDGRVGEILDIDTGTPTAPRILRLAAYPTEIEVLVAPGKGTPALVTTFEIDHRLSGNLAWLTKTVPAAEGGTTIIGYDAGDEVEIRARALSGAEDGAYTSIRTVTVPAPTPP